MMVVLKPRTSKGFTIVELLIVIVIIGILAAIVIIAYTGVQARAINASITSSIDQVTKSLMLYKSEQGVYPVANGANYCITTDNKCTAYDGTVIGTDNSVLVSSMQSYGGLPQSVSGSSKYYGINYKYLPTLTLSGVQNPLMIMFWLMGTNQDCQAVTGSMLSVHDSGTTNDFSPYRNSKADTGTGQTRCYLMFRTPD